MADDDPRIRHLVRLALEGELFEVVAEAANGREAIEKAGDLLPDMIIMDASMPLLTGIDATRQIKDARPEIVIVGFTGDPEDAEALRRAGATEVVPKSNFSELISRVNQLAPTAATAEDGVDLSEQDVEEGRGRGPGADPTP